MNGKAYPLSIERWPDIVVEGTGVLNDHMWFPMYTFVLGLPGEREEDVAAILELLDRLSGSTIFYVPLLFVPLEEAILKKASRAQLRRMSALHWDFIMECWKRNTRTWAREASPILKLSAFATLPYLRHMHGSKFFRSMMNFVGMPGMREVSWKRCEADYCLPMPRKEEQQKEADAA